MDVNQDALLISNMLTGKFSEAQMEDIRDYFLYMVPDIITSQDREMAASYVKLFQRTLDVMEKHSKALAKIGEKSGEYYKIYFNTLMNMLALNYDIPSEEMGNGRANLLERMSVLIKSLEEKKIND